MLREAGENTPLPIQEQGVWPRCGQGTSRWVRLTYKVNSLYFYLRLHVQQQEWIRSKNMMKVLKLTPACIKLYENLTSTLHAARGYRVKLQHCSGRDIQTTLRLVYEEPYDLGV